MVAVLVTGWWVELRPTSFLGGPATFIVVRGTSMLPTFHTGDFVLARSHTDYAVGEVVVYRVPRGNIGAGEEVIHRIVAGSEATGYTLKGDNNNTADPWRVPASDIMGSEVAVLPGAGEALLVIRSPFFAGGVAAMVAVSLVLFPRPGLAGADRRRRFARRAGSTNPRRRPCAQAPALVQRRLAALAASDTRLILGRRRASRPAAV